MKTKPTLSIVVIFYNMRREAERTLYSLSAAYQTDVTTTDYEVIAIDNGSTERLDEKRVRELGSNFKYRLFDTRSVSPASAVNFGVGISNGEFISVIVDGARMVTPGIVSTCLKALKAFSCPFVTALAWHLGPDIQHLAMANGYDRSEEDRLLKSIKWRSNGYRLFEISSLAPRSKSGFLGGVPGESSCFAMPHTTFFEVGGFDERFQSPGGGLVNQDFIRRVLGHPSISPVVILGEGSFHQMHGGVATNRKPGESIISDFMDEYQRIAGKVLERIPQVSAYYFGKMPTEAKKFIHKNQRRD